ncbi:hypothetical protein BH20CHL6_BH20CHL6_12710 [soil metagenome]
MAHPAIPAHAPAGVVPATRLAPGARGRRAVFAAALGVTLGQPSLWILGSMGFLARGGIVLLLMPILTLPSPVGLSTILGPELLHGGGLSERAAWLLGAAVIVGILALVAALAIAATADVLAFERYARDDETRNLRRARVPRPVWPGGRARQIVELGAMQALCLVPAAVAIVFAAQHIVTVTRAELISPTSLAQPIALRVIEGSREPLLGAIVALVLGELLYGLASRRLLIVRSGLRLTPRGSITWGIVGAIVGGLVRIICRPVGTLASFLAAWLVTVGVVVPVLILYGLAWPSVRAAYLSIPATWRPVDLILLGLVTVSFVGLWLCGALLCGFMSAVRAALWSGESLR